MSHGHPSHSPSSPPAAFTGLVDLASEALGGLALGASDDFFAGAENLLRPEPALFDPDRYTDRGKWMDGWESRRKRGSGHDWCIVRLGVPGRVYGFDVDTRFFIGNHPPFAAVEGLVAPASTSFADLVAMRWEPLLDQAPLGPGAQNLFAAEPAGVMSHVRLSIFPDGGVARLRVFGKVAPLAAPPEVDERTRAEIAPGLVDLAAVKSGGAALAASDARFGSTNNLLMPGRAVHMGGGWETRRGRAPDHRSDWILVRLAARGTLSVVEIDTNHYKGNFPERCSLDGIDWPGAKTTDLLAATGWEPLLPMTALQADTRHFFRLAMAGRSISHVRLNVFPDGGVSRLRLWGAAAGGVGNV